MFDQQTKQTLDGLLAADYLYLFVDRHGNGRDPLSMVVSAQSKVSSASKGKIITRGPRRDASMGMGHLVPLLLNDPRVSQEKVRELFPVGERIEFRDGPDGLEIWYSPFRWLPFIRERGLPDFLPLEPFVAKLAQILYVDWIMVLDWDGGFGDDGKAVHILTAYLDAKVERV